MSYSKRITALSIEDVMKQVLSSPPPAGQAEPEKSVAGGSVPTAPELLTALTTALDEFGKYQFRDKGPNEVMDLDSLVQRLRRGTAPEVAGVLRSFAHSGKNKEFRELYSVPAASSIVVDLQEWDELFAQPGIEELLNYEMPELQPGDEPSVPSRPAAKKRRAP